MSTLRYSMSESGCLLTVWPHHRQQTLLIIHKYEVCKVTQKVQEVGYGNNIHTKPFYTTSVSDGAEMKSRR